MRRTQLLLILILQLIVTSLAAQNYKFGKVSVEELEEISNPNDSTANATILFSKENIHYEYTRDRGFFKIKEIHKRIKIYNQNGLKWASKEIPMYNENNSTKDVLLSLKGVTYNLSSGKIMTSKLGKDGVFEEKTNKYWSKTKFTFSNVKAGSVVEYKYRISSPLSMLMDDAQLQELIPVKKLEYQARIPEFYNFKTYYNPQSLLKPEILTSSKKKNIHVTWTEQDWSLGGQRNKYEQNIEYKEKTYSVNEQNIPSLKKEVYVSNLNNYRSKLSFELASTKSFDMKFKSYSSDWSSITKVIYDNQFFGGQLDKVSYFKNDIDSFLSKGTNMNNKVSAIFDFIKTRVKWNGFNGVYSNEGVRKAYTNGEGNVADLNLMLIAILRYAGINANPILISTKSNGIPLFANRQGFNYVICGVEQKNKVLLLDATENFTSANILPKRALNWQGRIVREHGSSSWVSLFPNKNSISTTMISANLTDELVFKGKLRKQSTGYLAYNYRKNNSGLVTEDLIKRLSKNKGEIDISNLEIKNESQLAKPIIQSYNFLYEDGVDQIGSEVYINPLLFLQSTENIFNQKARKYDIDYNFPRTNKIIVNLKLGSGYKIKSIPKNIKLAMSDELGEYNYLVRVNGNDIQISQELKINSPIVPAVYYDGLRDTYKKMIEKNAEKIVLEKI